jgi:N,N-dimethylformamidase
LRKLILYAILVLSQIPACVEDVPEFADVQVAHVDNGNDGLYCTKFHFSPGETIEIFISTSDTCRLYLIDILKSDTLTSKMIFAQEQPTRNLDFLLGCSWESSMNMKLPHGIESGIYALILENEDSVTTSFPIIISDSYQSDLLVICSTNTWQAYNFWGGGSLYKLDSTWKEHGSVSNLVHFNRPMPGAINSSHLVKGELYLHKWLNQFEIPFDLCSDADLSSGIDLSRYKTVVLNCHNEYWTDGMYDAVANYTQLGGNLISLGANQMYARVTIKDGQMEFHEHGGKHLHDGSEGGLWRNLDKPESAILGVQYTMDLYDTYAPYKILDGSHWVFGEGNDLTGKQFGSFSDNRGAAAGHEMDVTTEFSPSSTQIIAKGLNGLELRDGVWTSKPGGAEIVIGEYPNGGQFFSVGSITFSGALAHDSIASSMLLNVIKRFNQAY